jgi:eukaryotic-like serine/threonine-protein kinase
VFGHGLVRAMVVFGVLLTPYGAAQIAVAADGMYRNDQIHSGTYTGNPGRHFAGVRWRYQTQGAVRSSPVVFGGTVYVGSSDGHLYALHAQSGRLSWRFDAHSAITSSPAVDDGSVFFQSHDGTVYALRRSTGSLRWRHRTGGDLPLPWGHESGDYWSASPTLANSILYIGSGDGFLYAFDAKNGHVLWKAKTGGRIRSAPAVSVDTAYIGSYDGYLYAFNTAGGALRWRFATQGASLKSADYGYDRRSIQSSPAVGDGAVFFGSKDGSLYAVDQHTGKQRWRRKAQVYWYMSAPAFDRHMVFTGNSDGRFIQALDAGSGEVRWQFNTGINVFASPSVAAGVVYGGAWDGVMHALDESSGAELWKFSTLGRRIFSSASVQGSQLVFGADDGGVYALGTSQTNALKRAVFYDDTLSDFNTVPASRQLRDFLVARGYESLDVRSLGTFLTERMRDRSASTIVFAMDAAPASIFQGGEQGLFARYLHSSGKVVWVGNPPLLWGFTPLSKRSLSDLDRSRPRNLIGVSYEFGNFDPMTAFVNAAGEQWGLSGSWLSNWSADPQTVTTVLASDEQGLAAAWVRGYGGRAGTGFVQLPLVVSPQGFPLNLFAIAIAAEYFP